jgi:hypothetical protein
VPLALPHTTLLRARNWPYFRLQEHKDLEFSGTIADDNPSWGLKLTTKAVKRLVRILRMTPSQPRHMRRHMNNHVSLGFLLEVALQRVHNGNIVKGQIIHSYPYSSFS